MPFFLCIGPRQNAQLITYFSLPRSYFINDKDQIKMISDPEQNFLYKINTNDRYNEMQKEAMNSEIPAPLVSSWWDIPQ